MKKLKFIVMTLILLTVFVICLMIGTSNNQEIAFNYIIAVSTFKISYLLAISFGLGFVIASIISIFLYIKIKFKSHYLAKQINKKEQEINKLKLEINNKIN